MPLSANSPLGPYKILSPVGAGGMGEVYKALDPRLHREVAIKVMSAEFAANPDRRARFEREARALAALNHPNIVAVYDVGDENGVLYSLSELVLGETLRARLARPPVSTREAIYIATQIASGMAAAHAAGITHRDLKPENIMINREGQVKILDFGLARQNEPATLAADDETGLANTQAGAILGTASYMSPEQARGQAVDYRSDQFSFGLVVYEMVSGAKAFERESAIQTMAAILNEDAPPVTAKIPPPFRWIVERCLSKDPRHRYDSTRDLYQELRNLSNHLSEALTSSPGVLPASEIPVSRPRFVYLVAVTLAVALAAALIFAFQLARKPDLLKYRYSPVETTGNPEGPVWAPDGKAFVYSQTAGGKQQMYIRYLDSPTASALGESSEHVDPLAWTPDSRRIFFAAQDAPQSKQKLVLFSIAAVGGEADSITSVDQLIPNLPLPSISPDGKTMAVIRKGDDGVYGLYTSSPIGSPDRRYAPAPFATKALFNRTYIQFSPDGRKILLNLTNEVGQPLNWLIPFPAGNNAPRVVLKKVPNTGGTLDANWMPDNRHVVLSHSPSPGAPNHISVADTESDSMEPLTSGLSNEGNPQVSPDGRKLLFTNTARDEDVVSAALDGSSVSRLIETSRSESMPA